MNPYKALAILFCITLFYVSASGQTHKWQIGLEGGTSIFFLRGDAVPQVLEPSLGYIGGISAQYHITPRFSLKSGIAFEKKQMKIEASITDSVGAFAGTLQINLNFYYYNFPLLAQLTFGNEIQFFVNAGPYLGQLIQQTNITEARDSQPEMRVEFTESYKDIDLGLAAGCGVAMSLGDRIFLNLEIRDNLGLYDIDAFNGEIRTNSLYGMMGLFYKFGAMTAD